ncbi:GrpB family protein [Acidobacteria bacterium AB60]|nr:GrpB family protein [Acidobacteria bacterium AB60]
MLNQASPSRNSQLATRNSQLATRNSQLATRNSQLATRNSSLGPRPSSLVSQQVSNPIILVDYDPAWPRLFDALRARIAEALGSLAARIEHIGSTAVPGLPAKPVIDIDVLLASDHALPEAIARLARIGYTHQGDLGIAGREAFQAPAHDPAHHLYVCSPDCAEFKRHLAFRDLLRAHPDQAKLYGDLKRSLAAQFRDDRNAYVTAKTEFVSRLTDQALNRNPYP